MPPPAKISPVHHGARQVNHGFRAAKKTCKRTLSLGGIPPPLLLLIFSRFTGRFFSFRMVI